MKISFEELVSYCSEVLGVQVEQIIRKTISSICLENPHQTDFTKEEALKICRLLKNSPATTTKIVGNLLHSRILITKKFSSQIT